MLLRDVFPTAEVADGTMEPVTIRELGLAEECGDVRSWPTADDMLTRAGQVSRNCLQQIATSRTS